jgi:cytochrome c oxidase assembly protein subunit 15
MKKCQLTNQVLRRLVLLSILLAIVVIGLGAYTRLTHAGLGCPDWPTCYGLLDVPATSAQISAAEQAFPGRPVEPAKAWNEMIHRYFAGALGLLILAIAIIAIKQRKQGTPVILPLFILSIVIFQAALGMWTVTMKLMPIVVMGHLLGGFTTLSLLFLLHLRLKSDLASIANTNVKKYRDFAFIGIIILTIQIALGGWTSSNYAALSCVELPICQGDWLNQLSFKNSFTPIPEQKESYEFGHLSHNERITIHIVHRFGAMITSVYLLWLAFSVFRETHNQTIKNSSLFVVLMLTAQVSLGISNIWLHLPLNIAVAHNLVAAFLMLSLISLTYKLRKNTEDIYYG